LAELLLEIGIEELPAPWLPGLGEQMRSQFAEIASREQLEPAAVAVAWAPRRLVLRADLVRRQRDRQERVFGPPIRAARDASGAWTSAALGFARRCGCRPDDLGEARKDGGAEPYLVHAKTIPGRATSEVLPGIVGALLRSLHFPKRMSWDAWLDDGRGALPFGRPIRWIVLLFGGEVVPFAIYDAASGAKGASVVESGAHTRGHRFLPAGKLAGRPIHVRSFTDLETKLAARFVLVDPEQRAARIRAGLEPHRPSVRDDHGLPAEWRDLVEYPTVVLGTIPAQLRTLPTEVLETVLVHHQKYVPVANEGREVSRFAAVINGDGANQAEIVRGMERVVVARLRDAAFFFEEDRRRPLAVRVSDLAGVTFQQGLGTYRDKAERMVRLVDVMGPEMGLLTKPEHEAAREAALLCKADLTTLMVREFPELQGVVGGIYLRAQGHPREDVARAVQWHYHPVSIEVDAPPAGRIGEGDFRTFSTVALADKLDTLAGYFGLGLVPTGSSDPYALRRAAQGVIRVLLDFWAADVPEERPSLRRLLAAAVAGYPPFPKRATAEVVTDLETFLLDRMRYVLLARGHAADEVEAVLGAREPGALDDPRECALRLSALHTVRAEAREDFEHLAVAFKRAKNILDDAPASDVKPALFEHDAEGALHAAVEEAGAVVGGYAERLRALARLRGPVDRFFDEVLVMAEDPDVRSNRLALLSSTIRLFYRISDISRLGG
jgi:glycyl-tRNA synthetase beta chain